MSFIDQQVRRIDARLDECRDELGQLQEARGVLTGASSKLASSQHSNGRSGPRQRKRERQAKDRQAQALEVIAANPGISSAELSRKLPGTTYGYTIVKRLAAAGEIEPCDKGWTVIRRDSAPS